MQVTIIPASSSVGRATVRALLASPSQPVVRAIYRDVEKAPEEFRQNPRFQAVRGDVGSGDLDFGASEAVLYVPPMVVDGSDVDEFATRAATNVKRAIRNAGTVKRLISQSALGSNREGNGILRINTITDELLRDAAPRTFIIRPCTFYDTWKPALEAVLKGAGSFESYLSPVDWKVPMVSVRDIASHCVRILLDDVGDLSNDDVWVFGPRLYSSEDVREAIETATGKKVEVKSVPREDLASWWGKHVPEKYVPELTEFTLFQLEGGAVTADYTYDDKTVRCGRELVEEFREWVSQTH
ncbi:hypothetical protein NLU13_5559 [Sarocladium strictum]|uniref:NmrA-like domain-containing protein n=1 Tax=Sarocladium strictum TaxID=5046 RepID=A0AA39GHG0_SARSR|nr:hypothetical protein NLU13_5559 [Sarocladium strictum]